VSGDARPTLVHLTTTDISLDWLLGPQLEAFARAGYDVVGISAVTDRAHVDAIETAGHRHVALRHGTRSMAPHRDAAALGELVGLFRELAPDIVHTHNPKPGLYGRLAARAAGVPIVVNTVHGLYALPEDPLAKRAVVYSLERVASACSDAELLQNPEDLPVLRRLGVPEHKLTVLGNGIDLGRFDPAGADPAAVAAIRAEAGAGPDDVLCGLVGRLVAEKGYREVFDAAARLRRDQPHLRIAIIGPDDPAKADAITAVERAAAERDSGIAFLGSRTDMVDLYAAMDLYALASYREGFPRSAMEAAAMGLPIVATDIRGCRQVVEHGWTGLLVPARDADALAAGLGLLAEDAPRRAAMGRAARAKAEREFDQERVIAITLDTYDRLRATSI
jgi:glycosyltransferase involved in cell wall biosynthesis